MQHLKFRKISKEFTGYLVEFMFQRHTQEMLIERGDGIALPPGHWSQISFLPAEFLSLSLKFEHSYGLTPIKRVISQPSWKKGQMFCCKY